MKKSAAQMTPQLPLALPRACRRLTKLERYLLCRAIDIAWGCRREPLTPPEYVTLTEVRGKLASAIGVKSQFPDREKLLLCQMIDTLWGRSAAPLRAADFTLLAEIQGRLEPRGGR